jgi:UDP-2,3-diacylglucosamine pyrophosphatase LpxH
MNYKINKRSENDEAIKQRLDEFYNGVDNNIIELPQNTNTKYALFSDLHLGDGKKADCFFHNEETMRLALNYYKENNYTLIFMGDVEDLWIFDLNKIKDKYDESIYSLIRSFEDERVYRIFGNHDNEWKRQSDPLLNNNEILNKAPEAIKLGDDIFLFHGHQGDYWCDRGSWFSKLFVQNVWARLVPTVRTYFNYENRSATKSQIPKNRERLFHDWAKKNKVILICGHTHNAIFASRSYYWWLKEEIEIIEEKLEKIQNTKDKVGFRKLSRRINKLRSELLDEEKKGRKYYRMTAKAKEPLPCYFNTGCGLFKNGITNIEIEGDKIRLIKWKKNKSLSLERRRKILWKEKSLSEIRGRIGSKNNRRKILGSIIEK